MAGRAGGTSLGAAAFALARHAQRRRLPLRRRRSGGLHPVDPAAARSAGCSRATARSSTRSRGCSCSTSCWPGAIRRDPGQPRDVVPRALPADAGPALRRARPPRRSACSSRAGRSPRSSPSRRSGTASPRPAPTRSRATSIRASWRSRSACSASARCCAAGRGRALAAAAAAGAVHPTTGSVVRRSGSAWRCSSSSRGCGPRWAVGGGARRRRRRRPARRGLPPGRSGWTTRGWRRSPARTTCSPPTGARRRGCERCVSRGHRRDLAGAAPARADRGPARRGWSPAAWRWSPSSWSTLPLVAAHVAVAVQLQVSRVFWMADLLAMLGVVWWLAEARPAPAAGGAVGPRRRAGRAGLVRRVLAALALARGSYALLRRASRPAARSRCRRPPTPGPTSRATCARPRRPSTHVLADPNHAWRFGTSLRVARRPRRVPRERQGRGDQHVRSADGAARRRTAPGPRRLRGAHRPPSCRRSAAASRSTSWSSERDLALPELYRNQQFRVYRLTP